MSSLDKRNTEQDTKLTLSLAEAVIQVVNDKDVNNLQLIIDSSHVSKLSAIELLDAVKELLKNS